MVTLSNAKSIKRQLLKRNIRIFLQKNYDWRAIRALSIEGEIPADEAAIRSSAIVDYDSRIAALEAANTISEVANVKVSF